MPENSVQMDWGMLERLFQEIDSILPDEKLERIVLFGGAAISYFNRIRVSVDADAFSGKFSPELKSEILNLAESVLHPSQMTPQLQAFVTNLAEELNQQ